MSGSGLWSASQRLLADAAASESPTDWWRIIGLAAVTAVTVAIMALLFRPGVLGRPDTPEPGGVAPEPNETGRPPGLYPLPPRPDRDPVIEATRAAERLRQIVGQTAETESDRRRLGTRREKTQNGSARAGTPAQGSTGQRNAKDEETSMESGEQGATIAAGAEQEARTAGELQEQIDRYFHRTDRPANVVQFAPRKPAATAETEQPTAQTADTEVANAGQPRAISQFPIDTAARDGITATIQELLFCANVGELLHGFALYSDRFLFQFMDDSRMSEDEFRQAYSDIPAKDPNAWIRIDSITGFARLPDGRIMVRVRYIDGAQVNGIEELTMKFDVHYERWLIDDIRAI